MNVRIAVPRRADGGRRDELWKFCRAWWTDRFDWPIVEGHHDDGPFNRGAAINQAAIGDWDVLLIVDSDVVANTDQVENAVQQAYETGRMTLAYDRYVALNPQMTDRVLDGYDGSWESGSKYRMTSHVSSVLAVRRDLWDEVRGFDERLVGWGHDDIVFAQSCRVLAGGVDRIPGTVWHLFHANSPERNNKTPLYRAAGTLAKRYHAALTPDEIRALVAERSERDGVCLVVVTHGRRDCIAQTIPSAEQQLKGPIVHRVISDDSGDIDYQAWLRHQFPGWEVVTGKPGGFAVNVIRGRDAALRSGLPYVFWLEDDFTFEEPIDLSAFARVLDTNPHLTQIALKRQAWFPAERRVGGFMEQHPDDYTQHQDGQAVWLEHQRFFTTNPHLTTRRFLAEFDWPKTTHSEAAFSQQVLRDGRAAGYWGRLADPPLVRHFGERNGTGY